MRLKRRAGFLTSFLTLRRLRVRARMGADAQRLIFQLTMRIVATQEARELIAERGGRLYVSIKRAHCCGGTQTLTTRTEAGKVEWRATGDEGGFELFLPAGLTRRPEELHVGVRRFPRRIEAYWNGCAWVV